MGVGPFAKVGLTHRGPQAGFPWKGFFFHLPGLDLHWCGFISVLKTRAEKRELLLRNGPADLSVSDLGKNCDNVTQYSTYFWDEKIRRLGDLT